MKDEQKTKAQLIRELEKLRKHNAELEAFQQERKQTWEALRESENRYRTLVETMKDGLDVFDENGYFTYVNKRFCEIIGYQRDELLWHHHSEFLDAENRERMQLQLQKRSEGIEEPYEIEWTRKDGTKAITFMAPKLVGDPKKGYQGSFAVVTDITNRKKAEKDLQNLTHELAERVKELNCLFGIAKLLEKDTISLKELAQGTIDLIPPAWQYPDIACARLILGDKTFRTKRFKDTPWKLTSKISVDARNFGALEVYYTEKKPERDEGPFLKEERQLIDAVANRLGRIIERLQAEEELEQYRNELEKMVEHRTIELREVNNKLVEEIEERKRAEEELKKSSEKIKLFAYSVSHDLKSPAIGIHGLIKYIHNNYMGMLDKKGKNYCNQVLKASEHLVSLVELINVYIRTKEAPLEIENCRLKEILQTMKEEFVDQLKSRKIRWSEPEHIPDIRADKMSIMRVIRNIVDNALKYGGEELSEISIDHKESDDEHILSVRDDGVGLKDERSKHIFQRFWRDANSKGIEGTGLGLAIVKEIAERHNGRVWLEPGNSRGLTFYITISKNLS